MNLMLKTGRDVARVTGNNGTGCAFQAFHIDVDDSRGSSVTTDDYGVLSSIAVDRGVSTETVEDPGAKTRVDNDPVEDPAANALVSKG